MTNCKNCGAPLHSYKCEYCGTEYPQLLTAIHIRQASGKELEEYRLKLLLEQTCCNKMTMLKSLADSIQSEYIK